MKNIRVYILSVLAAIIASYFSVQAFSPQEAQSESTYERVIRSGVIRCAYSPFRPHLMIDPRTGEKSGIYFEVINEIAKRLSLKIEWTEEVAYGNIVQGFETKRYDLFCNTIWPIPPRSRGAIFSTPLYYSPVGIFAHKDKKYNFNSLEDLNDPQYKFSIRDGDISDTITRYAFPKATTVSMSDLAVVDQPMIEILNGRVDFHVNDPLNMKEFNQETGDQLVNLIPNKPLKYFPHTFMMPKNEFQLKVMLDVTINELISEGFVDRLMEKYVSSPDLLYKVAQPFEAPK